MSGWPLSEPTVCQFPNLLTCPGSVSVRGQWWDRKVPNRKVLCPEFAPDGAALAGLFSLGFRIRDHGAARHRQAARADDDRVNARGVLLR